jgi:hypothetical protein
MRNKILSAYALSSLDKKENKYSPCISKKKQLIECLRINNYNMEYCNNKRLVYELCLLKNKEYRTKIKD